MPPANSDVAVRAARRAPAALEQRVDHRLPEHEARARPDVAAALAALEDEPARAVLEEQPQQARRRDVQVGGDALALQRARLVGPAAGDEREGRPVRRGSTSSCSWRSSSGTKPRMPTPQGVAEPAARVSSSSASTSRRRASAPAPGTAARRLRRRASANAARVADARHRPLQDRVARAVRLGQRRLRVERRDAPRRRARVRRWPARTPATIPADRTGTAAPAARRRRRPGRAARRGAPERPSRAARRRPRRHCRALSRPRTVLAERCGASSARSASTAGMARAGVDAAGGAELGAQADRLAAVHPRRRRRAPPPASDDSRARSSCASSTTPAAPAA